MNEDLTIESFREKKDKIHITGTHRINATIIDMPAVRIMNMPASPIGMMLCMCYNEMAKERGDYSTIWRVYPR